MDLWPAIDLLRGKAVRLHQGDYDKVTVYHDDPRALAASWRGVRVIYTWSIFEGARSGRPVEGEFGPCIVPRSVRGSRSAAGCAIALPSRATSSWGPTVWCSGPPPSATPLVREAATAHPGGIVLALDAKNGLVATDGWLSVSTRTAVEVVRELA